MTLETLRSALLHHTARFRAAGLDSPSLDARLLLLESTGLTAEDLLRDPDRPLASPESASFASLADRRLAGEPVARLLGHREFWGLSFALSPDTLIPRPETETLVEATLALIPDRSAPLRLADLGTGTGCLLIALLTELPQARGIGIDRSPEALKTAVLNAGHHDVSSRSMFVQADWAASLAPGVFDIIVSNPPYIASDEIADLEIDVKSHDPLLALDGGVDGLAAYRSLIPEAAEALRRGGSLLVEIGLGQAEAVVDIFGQSGLALCPVRTDLAGRARVVCGTRK